MKGGAALGLRLVKGLKIKQKTVDTLWRVSYFLRPVIGPERVKDREPYWLFMVEKPGFVVFCRLVRAFGKVRLPPM